MTTGRPPCANGTRRSGSGRGGRSPPRRPPRPGCAATCPTRCPGCGSPCCSPACRSPRRCCRAAGWCRAWSAGSTPPSATGSGCSRPPRGGPWPTGTPARRARRRGRCSPSRRPSRCPSRIVLGRYWQDRIRDLMGMAQDPPASSLLVLPVAAVVPFVALVAAARGLRWLYRHLDRRLRRWIGPRAADVLTGAVIVIGTVLVVNGVVVDGAVRLADHVFSLQNENTEPGVTPPGTGLRSGGPGSLVSWDSLGRYGRSFVAGGPTAAADRGGRGRRRRPAGPHLRRPRLGRTRRGPGPARRRRPRTGRRVLPLACWWWRPPPARAGSTPASPDTLEYLTGGDAATVTMQYSYLPSWLSYLVDQDRARDAGRELFDAVYARWSDLPAGRPPTPVRLRREPRLVRRGGRVQRGVRPAQPDVRRAAGRPAELQRPLPRASSTTATPAAPRSPRSSATAAPSGSAPIPACPCRPPASPGPARACCTCSTRRTRWCGGTPT